MRNSLKKAALLFVLVTAVALTAAPVFGVSAADFTDRFDPYQPDNKAYWGWEYIDYAAKAGIIEGYEQGDGTRIFLPANDVTKQEAVTMIVNTVSKAMLGYPALAETTATLPEKHAETLEAAHIAEWAYPYVAYAIDFGFVSPEEVSAFMVESDPEKTGLAYVSAPASREEVITWVGRALFTRYAKSESSVFSLSYTDADDVSVLAAPYLAVLTRIGIIEGIIEEDGTAHFDPKRTLTRVEFAVICNKVFERPKHSLTEPSFVSAEGTVSRLVGDGTGIGTFRFDGVKYYYYGGGTVYVNGEPAPSGFLTLRNGDPIVFSWDDEGYIRIDNRMISGTGKIVAIREADSYGYRLLSIQLPDDEGTIVKYYINPSADGVTVTGKLATNQSIAFLADGPVIVELANR
ncbi:MAG: S-layer homology domain-containing protein [Firmicutes bacterium]|nr:S-layer homology domain-containing protein [Bacillota bacterium]